MIDTLCIIGVGLIGGSLARALREAGLVRRVVGCGRDPVNLARAIELGVIDEAHADPAVAVAGAEMVVVAVTLGATGEIFQRIAPALAPSAIVTDVGSAKACVIEAARATLGDALPRFVPGHPIAGAEKSGVEASNELNASAQYAKYLGAYEETALLLGLLTDLASGSGSPLRVLASRKPSQSEFGKIRINSGLTMPMRMWRNSRNCPARNYCRCCQRSRPTRC